MASKMLSRIQGVGLRGLRFRNIGVACWYLRLLRSWCCCCHYCRSFLKRWLFLLLCSQWLSRHSSVLADKPSWWKATWRLAVPKLGSFAEASHIWMAKIAGFSLELKLRVAEVHFRAWRSVLNFRRCNVIPSAKQYAAISPHSHAEESWGRSCLLCGDSCENYVTYGVPFTTPQPCMLAFSVQVTA